MNLVGLEIVPGWRTTSWSTFIRRIIPSTITTSGHAASLMWLVSGIWPLAIIGIFLDCLDGFAARKLKTSTDFGSVYDYTVDVTVTSIIAFSVLHQPWICLCVVPLATYCRSKRWHFSGRTLLTAVTVGVLWVHGGVCGGENISIWRLPCSL